MTIGTTVISAATSASTVGHRRLRTGPEGDGLDAEVICWPLLVGEFVPMEAPASTGHQVLDQR